MSRWPWRKKEESRTVKEPSSISADSISSPSQPSNVVFPSGIKLLHSDENSTLDVVFVHGMAGDREETWKMKGASSSWPATLLPTKVVNSRVLTFGYDANVADWRGMVSKNRIGNHSMNLLTALATHREDDDTNNRPIIFVCHSLGGLVCQDALVIAQQRPEKHLKQILHHTRGIIFLGTPHHGSGLARWAETLAKTIGLIKQTNPEILAVLKSDSEVLERVQGGFHTMIRSRIQDGLPPIEITCFYEEIPLPGVGIIVPLHSAILPGYIPIGIRRNHMDMAKFDNANDPGFIAVAGELRRWSKELAKSQGLPPTTTDKQPKISSVVSLPGSETTGKGSGSFPDMNKLSLNVPIEQQNSEQVSARGGISDQTSNTEFYQGVKIADIPNEFAQHIPKSNMGPRERSLLKAAGKGDLEEVKRLLLDGANPSAISGDGYCALTKAISKKHNSIAQLLLDNGATTDYEGPLVWKPLHVAVQTGNLEAVELLLDRGADIDEVSGYGSVLAQAIEAGREDITSLLLSRDADIDLAPHHVNAPLAKAILRQNEPLIKDLLKRGIETDVLLHNFYQQIMKGLSESCQSLLRDWAAQRYEEPVKIIRSPSSGMSTKKKAFAAALRLASEHRQPEIYAMLKEVAKEFEVLTAEDYVYGTRTELSA